MSAAAPALQLPAGNGLAGADEHGLCDHILLPHWEEKIYLCESRSADGRVALQLLRDKAVPEDALVLAEGPCAVRLNDLMDLAWEIARRVRDTDGSLETARDEFAERINQADLGSAKSSGIEMIDAAEAFEQAVEAASESADVCYSHWAALDAGELRGEFLSDSGQFLLDVRSGKNWLESQLENFPAVNPEYEYGVMGC